MTRNDLVHQINLFKKLLVVKSPDILTVAGVVGFCTSLVYGIKVTPEAMKLIESAEKVKGEELTKLEVVKAAGTKYIPVGIGVVMSTGAIFGARKIDYKRYSALLAAYKISEQNFKEYADKVKEVVGDKKEQKIKDIIAQDNVTRNPVDEKEIIELGGNTLCYDVLSGRYFRSNVDAIRQIVNDLNYDLMQHMYVPLNDLYSELGLKEIKLGDMLGWNIQEGLINIDFSSTLAANNEPCLVLDYLVAPRYKYSELS